MRTLASRASRRILAKVFGAMGIAILCAAALIQAAQKHTTDAHPQLVLQLGHRGLVGALALSPDGQTVASGGADGTIRLWSAATGELKRVLERPGPEIRAIVFTPDGQSLVSASGDRDIGHSETSELLQWEVKTGRVQRILLSGGDNGTSGRLSAMVLSPDGQTVATASNDVIQHKDAITLWSLATGLKIRSIAAHTGSINGLAFDATGQSLASAGSDGFVKVWESATGKLKRSFKGQSKDQFAVAFSPDGKTLAGGDVQSQEMSALTSIHLWDVSTGRLKRTLLQGGLVGGMVFSPDGKTLLSGGGMLGAGEIQSWDVATGKSKRDLWGRASYIFPFVLSPDGQKFVTSGFTPLRENQNLRDIPDNVSDVQLWDAASGKVQRTFRGFDHPLKQVAWSRDGKNLIVTDDETHLGVWDANIGKFQATLPASAPFALSPNGQGLASADVIRRAQKQQYRDAKNQIHTETIQVPEPVVALRDLAMPQKRRILSPHVGASSLAFSPNGKTLAVQSFAGYVNDIDARSSLRLWDVASGRTLRTQKGYGTVLAYSPDGAILATSGSPSVGDQSVVQLWNASTGKLLRTLSLDGSGRVGDTDISQLVWAPDGKTLVGRSTFGIIWWNVQTGKVLRALATTALISENDSLYANGVSSGLAPLALSPDGQTLATETMQNTIRLWDFNTGRMKRELKGHRGAINSLAFSPDSRLLASASSDATLKIWDASTGELRVTLLRLPSSGTGKARIANWLAFTPTDDYAASPGATPWLRWRESDENNTLSSTSQHPPIPIAIQKALAP